MFSPWIGANGSLFLATSDTSLWAEVFHYRKDGSLDPTYEDASAAQYAAVLSNELLYAAARCDGTELFIEFGPYGHLVIDEIGPNGPQITSAGTLLTSAPGADEDLRFDYGVDSHGALYVLSFDAPGLRLDRFLPAR